MNNLVEYAYSKINMDNIFCIFKSINDILYLIYTNYQKSIISYNLIDNRKINEIKNAHKKFIINSRHYLDKKNNLDLIMSISSDDNNIKLWKTTNWECLLNLTNINNIGRIEDACFLYNENNNFILTSNCNYEGVSEPIKIFDFQGNKLNEIKDSKIITKYIDIYYDIQLNKNYIITGNRGFSVSYDYESNKI